MIQIKRGAATVATVNPISSSNMSKAVLGEEQITLVWEAPAFVPFYLGDYITFEGSNWTLNKLPTVKKLSSKTWQYNAVFQSTKYELIKAMYLLFDNTDTLPSGEFPLTGTADTFMQLLVANLNRVIGSAVWSVGQVIENTDYKNLTFSNEDCLSVLGRLADEFETEYHVSNHVIHLKKISTNREVTLEYGSTLYDIERSSVDSSDVCTRLYAFGSTKNLASDYRGGNSPLRLPDANGDYIESNVNLYGVIERAKTFDAIYPRLSSGGAGVITSVGDEFTFYDSHLDFNVNDYLLDGTTAKVHFNTGECAGYDFEIAQYAPATKKFVIIANTQENDFTLPSADLKPAVGDKYVLIDIVMPPAYLAAAEAELLAKAQEFISQNSTPKVAYKTTFSAIYAKQNLQNVECGDTVTVYDEDMGIDEQIRIIKLQKGLTDFWTVQFDLANTVTATRLERIEGNVSAVENTVIVTNQRVNRNNLRAYQNTKELREMVFDPDGYFDAGNIKPLSIETSMLSVGSKSQSFQLGTLLQPNYAGNPQVLQWSAGLLTHFTIVDNAIKEWTFASGNITITGGNQTAALYIYARCSRAGTTGDIYLSATATKFDADATYYFFLIGVLHTPINSVRGISLTYGQTTINGQYIKTGVISSIDGATYFNLNTGEIGGNIKFKSTDGSLKTVDQAIVEAQTENTNYVDAIKADLQSQIDGNITSFFYDYAPTLANIPASSWTPDSVRDIHLGDLFYWTSKGYAYRFQKVAGVYSWTKIADTDVTKALADAAKAQDTADGKRRVFVSQPLPPYDLGDLWSQGTSGDLMKCKTAKTIAQSYSVADWEKASKYTDDTAVNNMQIGGRNLLPNGDFSKGIAGWSVIGTSIYARTNTEFAGYMNTVVFNDAGNYNVANLYRALNSLLISVNTTVLTFSFMYYQYAANKALMVDFDGDVDKETVCVDNNFVGKWKKYAVTLQAATNIKNLTLNMYGSPYADGYVTNIQLEVGNKATDYTPSVEDVQKQIDDANAELTAITSNGVFDKAEKISKRGEWETLSNDHNAYATQASALGVSSSYLITFSQAFSALANYLNAGATWISPQIPFWISDSQLSVNTTIDPVVFRAKYKAYYDAKTAVLTATTTVVNTKATSLDFVKSAVENGSSEFNGGLGLINLLFQKTLDGDVNGGMSGVEGDGVLNWGGSTYENAGLDVVKAFGSAMSSAFLNREDGGGHLAFGKIAWDMLGKLLVGNFEIINGNIIGKDSVGAERIRLSTENVPDLTSLTSNYTYAATNILLASEFEVNVTDTGVWSLVIVMGSSSVSKSIAISIPYATTLIVENTNVDYGCQGAAFATGLTQSVTVKNASGTTVASGNAGSSLTIPSAGNYTVIIGLSVSLSHYYTEGQAQGYVTAISSIKYMENVAKTSIGLDGLYSYFSALEHFYFKSGVGLRYRGAIDVPAGLGGGRVSSTGSISGLWGVLTKAGNGASKSGSDYSITHYIGNTDYSLILTPKSSNIPYFLDANRGANTIIATCSGGFDFVLIRTK